MRSLQQQLRHHLFWTLLLVMGGMLLLVDFAVKELTHHYILKRLSNDAESLLTHLKRENDRWQLPTQQLATFYQRVNSGHYYLVHSSQQALRSRSLWDFNPQITPLAPGEQRMSLQSGAAGQRWLTLTQGFKQQGENLTLWIAEDISDLRQLQNSYRLYAILLVITVMFLLLALQQRLLQRTFARLEPLREMIRAMHTGSLQQEHPELPEEVQPLMAEIEHLITQLQQRTSRSRNALGNLAHDLKRPLQQLQLASETLPEAAQQEQLQIIQTLRYKIERELKRARIVGASSPGRHTHLALDLPPLCSVLEQLYPHCQIITQFPENAVLLQDRDDMIELFGNLLDNACRYAGGEITLALCREASGWRLNISDHGPGIAPQRRQALMQRGQRLDEDNSLNTTGSGLGLAICEDIVHSYHATLTLEANPDTNYPTPGLRVSVLLPDIHPPYRSL
ncbi:MAG: sensor histidine kinase [Gammaproteobacteria bacterium]|nr:sensor histidine kinase [Gammaproteobacteria bacterium]